MSLQFDGLLETLCNETNAALVVERLVDGVVKAIKAVADEGASTEKCLELANDLDSYKTKFSACLAVPAPLPEPTPVAPSKKAKPEKPKKEKPKRKH